VSTKVGVWEPRAALRLDAEKLGHLVTLMNAAEGDNVVGLLSEREIANEAGLMKLNEEDWQAAESLEDFEITTLIRFFTLAEMQYAGWDGGKQSPVIYLVRILRRRDNFPAELRKWIKAHTENRFLPYGSAL